ncbi:hypothetical protein [Blastopirellula marina]|uniref:Uncharacterized protein n=1 Tax=Blastopirellula marina TaxID=124 RepID=A0A2S8GDX5_9BACT|nr:hypothetical protein [Blastopirellula marina]PQO42510.1 hypothetical protein C5Y93_29745 [Blastopirellula marina]
MEAYKSAMMRLLRHPTAWVAGIIVTFLVALLTLIPAADEYSVLRERSEEVAYLVQQGTRDRDWFPQLNSKYAEIQKQLQRSRQRTVDEEAAHALRESIVQQARKANCHLRRVDLGAVRVRQWYEHDHPIETVSVSERGKKSKFLLEVRELRLTVSGSMENIQRFITQFETLDVQMHVEQLNLRTIDPHGDQVQLELGLQLYGIQRAVKEKSPVS